MAEEKKKLEMESENIPIKEAFEKAEKESEPKRRFIVTGQEERNQISPGDIARGIKKGLTPVAKTVGKELKESGRLVKKEAVETLSEYKPSEVLKRRIAQRRLERKAEKEYIPAYYEGARSGYRQVGRYSGERKIKTRQAPMQFPSLIGNNPKVSFGYGNKNKSNVNLLGGDKSNMNIFGGSKSNSNLLSMGSSNVNLLGSGKKKKEIRMI